MENASKALIIAGAILLSILIIALGVLVYNQAQNAVSNASMDSNKIATYNAEFESYLGDKVKGETVKSLLDIMKNHNLGNSSDQTLIVTASKTAPTATTVPGNVTAAAANTTINEIKNGTPSAAGIQNGKTYKVVATYDANTGFIFNITITANS